MRVPPPLPARHLRRLRRFGQSEGGSMTVFALFLFVAMLIMGGLAVDVVRFEMQRSRVQATLDRAVLAAGDLEQPLPPEAVVRDYFAKAGLPAQLPRVAARTTLNSRVVSASARVDVDTMFMRMAGVEELTGPAAGQAEESKSDIEVILVLDVSGSMDDNNRIGNLRTAANAFVTDVLRNDTDHRITIGVVPFNSNVNLGPDLLALYDPASRHGVADANCLDLDQRPTNLFTRTDIPFDITPRYAQSAYIDFDTTTNRTSATALPPPRPVNDRVYCRQSAPTTVRLPTSDMGALQTHVRGLVALGGTSINLGMKWGLAMIDPSMRPAFEAIPQARVPVGRPFAYNREDTLKVIVLMTDGQNEKVKTLQHEFRDGVSRIFRATDGRYSIFHPERVSTGRPYWVPHVACGRDCGTPADPRWQVRPWNGAAPTPTETYNPSATEWPNVTRLPWHQVWSSVTMPWVATNLYASALGGSWTSHRDRMIMDNFRDTSAMNAQLRGTCDLARANGVRVFTVNLEAPGSASLLRSCASGPLDYLYTTSGDLGSTFQQIAATITALRLSR